METALATLKYFRSFRLPLTGNKKLTILISPIALGSWYEAKALNFSLSGLAMVSKTKLESGTQLKIKLSYKNVDYLFHAQVRRSLQQDGECLIGVEFDQNDHFLSKRFLEKFIYEFNKKDLKGHVLQLITDSALPNNIDSVHELDLVHSCFKELIPKRLSRKMMKYAMKDFCLFHGIAKMKVEILNGSLEIRPITISLIDEKYHNHSYFFREQNIMVNYEAQERLSKVQIFELNTLLRIFSSYKEDRLSIRENKFLVPSTPREFVFIGQGEGITRVRKFISKIKYNSLPVGISGNAGDGKSLLAKIIHTESKRKDGPVRVINGASFYDDQEITGLLNEAFEQCHSGSVVISNYDRLSEAHRKIVRDYTKYQLQEREKRARVIMTLSPKGVDIFKSDFEIFLKNDEFLFVTIPELSSRSEDVFEIVHFFSKKICDQLDFPNKIPTKAYVAEIEARVASGNIRSIAHLKKVVKESIELNSSSSVIDLSQTTQELLRKDDIVLTTELNLNEKELELKIIEERYRHFNHDLSLTALSLGCSTDYLQSLLEKTKKVA